ncbi:hypothetical protein [Gloeocapsa sp. PCC 73106]|uniref:hypothetical protein n=1 Tax=Gloeocapsa sp. PCC 73106 TaxID=102232 RepID=UPI0002AC9E62|nr:hypothetical protein [Gloeocapsa sp. PCC 73106]ELR97600.1 hypothetical protein GLO73106DRAFT_00014110 [Gloeocapsa sp. PCC 73106]
MRALIECIESDPETWLSDLLKDFVYKGYSYVRQFWLEGMPKSVVKQIIGMLLGAIKFSECGSG